MAQAHSLIIDENTPEAWEHFHESVGFVPDPMVLRAADVFLMGKERWGDAWPQVWDALEKNFSSILLFFDTLVTRDRIPLINYWQTFSLFAIEDLLRERSIRVDVQGKAYQHFHTLAVERLKQLCIEDLPQDETARIEPELAAFEYDWRPSLDGLVVPESHIRAAEFMLGGLVFGSYASKSQSDHLIQSGRSRLFVALSAPPDERQKFRLEQEQKLFATLREACLTGEHVRVEHYPLAPSVVPFLVTHKRPKNPRELFMRVLEFREKPDGRVYREWFEALRDAWSWGRAGGVKPLAEVERVWKEVERCYKVDSSTASAQRVDIGFDLKPGGVGGGVVFKDLPLPRWVRQWLPEGEDLKPHGKVLFELSMAQRDYKDLVSGLKRIWKAA